MLELQDQGLIQIEQCFRTKREAQVPDRLEEREDRGSLLHHWWKHQSRIPDNIELKVWWKKLKKCTLFWSCLQLFK